MAFLIQTAETNAFLQLAKFVADLMDDGQGGRTALADTPASKFAEDGETFIAQDQYKQLLQLLLSQAELVFSKASAPDVDTYVSLISPHLLSRIAASEAGQAASDVCSTLSSQVDDHAEARLQGLAQVFNAVSDSPQRLAAFTAACSYAQRAGLATLLSPLVKAGVDTWLKELALSSADERRFLFAAAGLLRSSKRRQRSPFARDAFRLNQRALLTLKAGDDVQSEEVQEATAAVIIDFVRFPDVFQFDLASSAAVESLKGHAKHGDLHALLTCLLQADVKALKEWTAAHPQVVEQCQASQEDVETKGRLLALLALGAPATSIPLSHVQEVLDCGEGEVEGWVVRAIGRKLIEARIDQLQRQLVITRTTQRTFGPSDWGRLASQLRACQGTVEEIKEAITANQAQAAPRRQ